MVLQTGICAEVEGELDAESCCSPALNETQNGSAVRKRWGG